MTSPHGPASTPRFVESEFYDAPAALGAREFDLVYTGVGALNWLPDIQRWAEVVAQLLRPGGRLYIREGHPMLYTIEDDMRITLPYFEWGGASRWETDVTYTDGDGRIEHPVNYEWNHGLAEVVQAVLDAGLVVTRLVEHDFCEWQAMTSMVFGADRKWHLPDHPERLPLMYTLEARKPAHS